MKSRLKKPSTIISIALVVTVILAAVIWTVQAGKKDVTVPFSSVEKIIASQDGKTVAVQEYKNGKLLITAPDGEYISHVPPNSDMVDKLVETYNIQYTFAATGPYTPGFSAVYSFCS